MNPIVFMISFVVAVTVIGTGIFFYWRAQYGVWAEERKKRQQAEEKAEVVEFEKEKK